MNDFVDWFVRVLLVAAWSTGTVYLFKHPSDMNFATWGTVSTAMVSAYHWLTVRDQKIPDAREG